MCYFFIIEIFVYIYVGVNYFVIGLLFNILFIFYVFWGFFVEKEYFRRC